MKFFIFVALAVIGLNANSKLYVCYDSKTVSSTTGNLAYLGCKRYHDSCASNGKLHFGKYPTSGKASGALNRCLKSSPKFVNNGKAKGSSTSTSTQTATVTGLDPNGDGFLSLRKKPKQREIGKLYNGDKVEILSKSGKYYKVKDVKSGMIGYAHSNWIRKTSNSTIASTSTSQKQGTVHGLDPNGDGFLSVRSKPKGKKIGKLYNGDKVAILGQRGAWYKVRTSSGLVGWSHGDWVSVNGKKIYKKPKKRYIAPKRRKYSTGDYVCSTFSSGKNGWCGYITQNLGNSVRVENYKVKCNRGGFLGICTNVTMGSCGGNVRLFTDEEYKNPRSLIVPKSCLD